MGIFVSIQTVQANPITRQQALQHAQEFLQQRGMNLQKAPLRNVPALKSGEIATENAPYYVFNIGDDNGFVIASGDDCAHEILGYSDKGHFDAENMPDGLKDILDFYAEQINYGSKSSKVAKPKTTTTYPAVEPMLTTEWGQHEPYNDNCPISPSTGERCVTGCVATAMAQVMYYHRNNHSTSEVVKAIPSYGSVMVVQGVPKGSPIDWDNMLDTYDSTATEVQRQAVANLMLYCGTSVEMGYGSSYSAAYSGNVAPVLVNYFDYYDDASWKYRDYYTDTEWDTMVYEELGKGNPIYYTGTDHAFVIDGHDGNGYVHVNWGWDGTDNGHYWLNGYIHGSTSTQTAIFGAVPNKSIPRLTTKKLSLTSSNVVYGLTSRTSIPVSLEMTVTNQMEETGTYEQAIGLYKLGELQSVLSPIKTISGIAPGASRKLSVSLELESTVEPEVFTLVPISRPSGSDKWQINGNPDLFVTMSIYGGSAHFTVGTPGEEGDIITFACDEVRRLCVENWDMDGDGALSKEEAANVTSLYGFFSNNQEITSFDELQCFTGLTEIENYEFSECSNLTSVIIPPNVTSIGYEAFWNCYSLQHVIIPKSVTSIGDDAFMGSIIPCNLQDIRVENGNPVYDSRNNCNALIETATNLLIRGGSRSAIPDGVVTIAPSAFYGCSELESIHIPESVTSIGEYAFEYCSDLTTVNIPSNVTSINSGTFACCYSLTSLTIPSNVISIEDDAFWGCTGLTNITIPSSVTSISSRTFYNCKSLTSFTIPESVTSIGWDAFSGCSGLTSITIPSSVTSIYKNPFSGCSGLRRIVVEAGNPCYHSDANNTAIIETATNTLVTGCANTVIPSDVVAIGDYAFSKCSSLTSIVIPNGVTTIGYGAFRECSSLQSISISSSVTSIGYEAFYRCTSLQSINIPSGVTSIGRHTFEYCSSLQSINIPSGVTSIESNAFQYCSNLATVHIPVGVTSIGYYAFAYCKNLTAITIPSTVTSIGVQAFRSCIALTSIKSYIKNVFNTGSSAFSYCRNATLYVPEGLVEVYQQTSDWNSISNIEEMPVILDVNGDGSADIADVIFLIDKFLDSSIDENYYYDINNDETISITDVITLIDLMLAGRAD